MDNSFFFNPVLFEPTISILKNAILINYKKVGTRYFNELSSLPEGGDNNKKQIDLQIRNDYILPDSEEYKMLYEYTKLEYRFSKYHVYTEFDLNKFFSYNNDIQRFSTFTSSIEMLEYVNCKNYNELFFDNKDRDIIFIIRNPLQRLITGLTQILYSCLHDLPTNDLLRDELKYYSKLTDSNIKNVIRYTDLNNVNDVEYKLEHDSLLKIISFISEKKWDWILQDIHTQNYLNHYLEMIYHIQDKNKIKIIDLKDCRSDKAFKFFTKLRGDSELEKNWNILSKSIESNKLIYKFYQNYIDNNKTDNPLLLYLKDEFRIYADLINSPYYVDLKD